MATPDHPACCTHHPACPAYIYDDPEAVDAYKRKKKKVVKRCFPPTVDIPTKKGSPRGLPFPFFPSFFAKSVYKSTNICYTYLD